MPAVSNIKPAQQTVNFDRNGTIPVIQQIQVNIMDAPQVFYTQYHFNFENTEVQWLYAPSASGSYLPFEQGANYLQLAFKNIEYLPSGTYYATVVIELSNADNGYFNTMDCLVILNLTGIGPSEVAPEQSSYDVVYNRSDNTLSGETTINIVNNTGGELLKFWQNSNVFAPASGFADSFSLAEDPGNPLASNPLLPPTGNINIPAKILKTDDTFVAGFNINLTVVDGGISVQPSSLAFEVFKFATEQTHNLNVINPLSLDFTIEDVPSWLAVSPLGGNSSQNISVTTNTSGLNTGNYTANLKFVYGTKFLTVPVALSLKSFVEVDEVSEFSLDLAPIVVNKKTENAYFVRFSVVAQYQLMGKPLSIERQYIVPYFQEKAQFDIGKKLHRFFPRWKKQLFDLVGKVDFMKKVNAVITVEELDENRNSLFSQELNPLRLFPGKKPAAYPLLSTVTMRKVNTSSILFVSTAEGDLIKTEKRGVVSDIEDFGGTLVYFAELPASYGVVHLQWENQNLAPEWFTFTGEYRLSPEFNHIYARDIFRDQNEKYDVTKVNTLTISTGPFLSSEREMMTALIESRISFLKIGERVYRCFNITKKNVELDSTEEIISRDLEFLIVEENGN